MLELRTRKNAVPAGREREVIEPIRQGLQANGIPVSIGKPCRWFEDHGARCSDPPADEGHTDAAGSFCGPDQGHDRGKPIVRPGSLPEFHDIEIGTSVQRRGAKQSKHLNREGVSSAQLHNSLGGKLACGYSRTHNG